MNQSPFKKLRHPYDTFTFKSKALCLASNEGRVKCLLLLYKRLIQPYLWLLLVMHFVTRIMPINDIDSKSVLTEKQPQLFSQSFKIKITPLVIYGLRGEYTRSHILWRHESDFK